MKTTDTNIKVEKTLEELKEDFANKARMMLENINLQNAAIGAPEESAVVVRIPIGWLETNPKYQRFLRVEKVDRAIGRFQFEKIDVKKVNYRDGKYYLIDGKHTASMLERLGYKYITVSLMFDKTYEEEAALFYYQYDGCTRVGIVDAYDAAIEAKFNWAIDIKRIAAEKKVFIDTRKKRIDNSKHVLSACSKLKVVYENTSTRATNGKAAVDLILSTIIDAGWYDYEGAFKSDYLEIGCELCRLGVTKDIETYKKVTTMLSKFSPDEFIGETKKCYPSNTGKHGEGSIKDYIRNFVTTYCDLESEKEARK